MIITDKKLNQIYDNWQDKLDADEWYFSNSFELISKDMSSDVAFNYIPEVVNALLELHVNKVKRCTISMFLNRYYIYLLEGYYGKGEKNDYERVEKTIFSQEKEYTANVYIYVDGESLEQIHENDWVVYRFSKL